MIAIRMRFYDYILTLGWLGSIIYTMWIWMTTAHTPNSFSIVGAILGISFVFMMTKFTIASIGVGVTVYLPKLKKKFDKIGFSKVPTFTIFNKRIEIRIIDKDSSRVTF